MNSVLRSSRVLTDGYIQPADVVIRHGFIEKVAPFKSQKNAYDLGQRLIVPGFVDLHSDAVEKEIEPRPGAHFPIASALVELDKKLTMAGITTMFHAVGFNDAAITGYRATKIAAHVIEEINTANRHLLGVDNFVHARFEVTSFESVGVIKELIHNESVHLLSVMDHTPGQGQFKSIENWKKFHLPVYKLSDSDADEIIRHKIRGRSRAFAVVEELLRYGAEHDLVLLSHDDDSRHKIDLLKEFGVSISEFPLDVDIAVYAKKKGIATGMGAPNVVRGESQSGNVSARKLIVENACDFLCSDYHPSSMLQAPYTAHREIGLSLERCFDMVTSTPARLAGLNDRGEIRAGKIADLVVIEDANIPKVILTLKEGSPVYNGTACLCGE
ncbi:metal-dependent hydrolase involved in phosphonate metabolism [Desulfocapsa sulfexigens DSM 10523]|uniref:Metal-dependent hydrolase involved in phosphonate metabolism n=1 Tax=Desulfocapsa sulfexigens (strain DSM 10523 / SB164P1) TaxID=1167006 RepID=M1PNV2_DESSD|nr:alpha-D-ribose 1-methylphosphonate 5-triphosphate diphosphatase [Desulfocapsa sulfexigens]AGF78096.1 metal-dependent hydrolase involved in phosphonate metabolism [Desulfocapsa sulfexigens DSM 10523]